MNRGLHRCNFLRTSREQTDAKQEDQTGNQSTSNFHAQEDGQENEDDVDNGAHFDSLNKVVVETILPKIAEMMTHVMTTKINPFAIAIAILRMIVTVIPIKIHLTRFFTNLFTVCSPRRVYDKPPRMCTSCYSRTVSPYW